MPVESVSGLSKSLGVQANQIVVVLQRIRVAIAGILIMESARRALPKIDTRYARETEERLSAFSGGASMNSGRSCAKLASVWTRCLHHIALRQVAFSSGSWGGAQIGSFWAITVGRPKVGSPKPGLTFGDSGLDFTSTSRVTTSPFPSAESRQSGWRSVLPSCEPCTPGGFRGRFSASRTLAISKPCLPARTGPVAAGPE